MEAEAVDYCWLRFQYETASSAAQVTSNYFRDVASFRSRQLTL